MVHRGLVRGADFQTLPLLREALRSEEFVNGLKKATAWLATTEDPDLRPDRLFDGLLAESHHTTPLRERGLALMLGLAVLSAISEEVGYFGRRIVRAAEQGVEQEHEPEPNWLGSPEV